MSDESNSSADAYPRFPHVHGDSLCFVAEDDLWLAPLPAPGRTSERAWRLTADRTQVGHPRFSPDGDLIAFTSWRTLDPEIHLLPVGGGPARQLTHWASYDTRVRGWTPPDASGESRVLAVSSHNQPFSHFTWSYTVPTVGGPGEQLPWGPVADIAVTGAGADRRTLLLTGKAPHEPAAWKRYRGGATGKLWYHGTRLLADLAGHLDCPMLVGDRVAFLSDHEGVGNLYSCRPDGTELWRHTDHDAYYARHAATDGRRVVYQCGGELWLVDELTPGSRPRRLDVRLGGPRTGRRAFQVRTAANVDALAVDATGRASAVCVRGALYWLTHRDGPARALSATTGVRVRLPEMLGDTGRIAYVTDASGEDAIEIAHLPRASGDTEPLRLTTGDLGRVRELRASPDGELLAAATHDGRLLLIEVPPADETEEEPDAPQAREEPGAAGSAEAVPGPPTGPEPGPAAADTGLPADNLPTPATTASGAVVPGRQAAGTAEGGRPRAYGAEAARPSADAAAPQAPTTGGAGPVAGPVVAAPQARGAEGAQPAAGEAGVAPGQAAGQAPGTEGTHPATGAAEHQPSTTAPQAPAAGAAGTAAGGAGPVAGPVVAAPQARGAEGAQPAAGEAGV
ncbi:peptidase S41, partial [Streptomyces sp. NPDC127098]